MTVRSSPGVSAAVRAAELQRTPRRDEVCMVPRPLGDGRVQVDVTWGTVQPMEVAPRRAHDRRARAGGAPRAWAAADRHAPAALPSRRDDGDAPQGEWAIESSGETPVPDDFIAASDIIEQYPDSDPNAEAAFIPVLIRVGTAVCFKYCDDAARALFKGGRAGVRKVKKGLPRNWRVLRPHRDWVIYAGKQPGQRLTQSMTRAGRAKPTDYAAHHIVAATARYARKAQAVLSRCGMRPNDARNGVYLPLTNAARQTGDVRPLHGPIHTQGYYHNVNEIISANYYGWDQSTTPHSQRCAKVFEALDAIRDAIVSNKFVY